MDNETTNNQNKTEESGNIPTQRVEVVRVEVPGESNARASLILGIIAAVFGFTGVIPFILGIAGLVQANKANKLGCKNSSSTAGFILSLICVIIGGIVTASFVLCLFAVSLSALFG